MKTKISQNAKAIILGLILTLGLGYVMADFQGPPGAPTGPCPTGTQGCDAPINVGPASQTKAGLLSLVGLSTGTFTMNSADKGAGKVLTSDANGVGTWQSGLRFVGIYTPTDLNTLTIPVPAGATKLIVTPTASILCRLTDNAARVIELEFDYRFGSTANDLSGTILSYASLKAAAGSNADNSDGARYAAVGVTASTNGVITIVPNKPFVNLSTQKITYKGGGETEIDHVPGISEASCSSTGGTNATYFMKASILSYIVYAI